MFTAAFFMTTQTWKQPTCPSTDEWISKMRCIYTMDGCFATKQSEVLTHAAAWRNLENVLGERTRTQKAI